MSGSANLISGATMTASSYLPLIAGGAGLAFLAKKARSLKVYTSYKERKLI